MQPRNRLELAVRAAVATLLAAVVLGSVSGSSAETTAMSQADGAEGDDISMPPNRSANATADIPNFESELRSVLGDRYAEFQFGADGTSVLVGATDATASDAVAVQRALDEVNVTVIETARSSDEMEAIKTVAWSLLVGTGGPAAIDAVTTFSDTESTQAIEVFLPREPSHGLLDRLEKAVPPELLKVSVDSGMKVEDLHSSRTSYGTYESGLQVVVAGGVCTSNFVYMTGYGPLGTTAGHCTPGAGGYIVSMGGSAIDHVRSNLMYPGPTYTDTLTFSVADDPISPLILIGTNAHRTISGRTNGPTGVNVQVCWQGMGVQGSGRCSPTTRNSINYVGQNGVQRLSADCTEATGIGGDSGGPVYIQQPNARATAAGTVSSNVTFSGNADMCFTRVQFAVWFIGSEILTG